MELPRAAFFDSGGVMEQVIKFINGVDPQGGGLALLWFAVLGFSAFFVLKVWPWLTTVYFPAKIKEREMQLMADIAREDKSTAALAALLAAVAELKSYLQQLNDQLQQQNQWLLNALFHLGDDPLDKGGK